MTIPELYAEIEEIGQAWPELRDEPNLQDIHWLAWVLIQRLPITVPEDFPSWQRGVELVELVERTLLVPSPGHMLRDNSPADLVDGCKALIQEIRDQHLLQYDNATNVVVVLLGWVGCLRMAKSLRVRDAADVEYTDQIRQHDYARLAAMWDANGRYAIGLDIGLKHDRTVAVVAHAEPVVRTPDGTVDTVTVGARVVLDRIEVGKERSRTPSTSRTWRSGSLRQGAPTPARP